MRWAASGEEVLAMAHNEPAAVADLILLDLMLPDMSGTELVTRLSQSGPVPPVVIHSAFTQAEAEAAGERIGAAAVLRKPTDWTHMKEVLERVCATGASRTG